MHCEKRKPKGFSGVKFLKSDTVIRSAIRKAMDNDIGCQLDSRIDYMSSLFLSLEKYQISKNCRIMIF